MRRRALAIAAGASLALAAGAAAGGAGARVVHRTFFETPSRNIGCVILDGTARCDIVKRTWATPPRPANCPSEVDFGQGLTVSRTGTAQIVCAGDTALDPHAAILPYGSVDAVGVLRCTSRVTGVTCRSTRTGHGFFISRRSYSLF